MSSGYWVRVQGQQGGAGQEVPLKGQECPPDKRRAAPATLLLALAPLIGVECLQGSGQRAAGFACTLLGDPCLIIQGSLLPIAGMRKARQSSTKGRWSQATQGHVQPN